MVQSNVGEEKNDTMNNQEEEHPLKGLLRYFQWVNEDWLSLFIGLIIVLLALLGILDWVEW